MTFGEPLLVFCDRVRLLLALRERFVLDWQGIHGVPHWGRVWHHGLRVGRQVGANLLVVELFAFLHDAISHHSDGLMHDKPTIQTCRDADRLDLGRVGVIPCKEKLSDAASSLIDAAQAWRGGVRRRRR